MIVTIISFAIVQYVLITGYQEEVYELLRFPYLKSQKSNNYTVGTIVLVVMGLFGNDVVFLTALNALLALSFIKFLMMWKSIWKQTYKKYDAAISLILLFIMNIYALSVLFTKLTR